jgi:hypothetical protein
MIRPLRFPPRLGGNALHHGRAVIRYRGQQYAHKKQRAQANGEFGGQLHQSSAGEHGLSRVKRDAQFVPFHDTNAAHEIFRPISIRVPHKNCPVVQAIALFSL